MTADARPRVMVVDDDPAVQAVVRIALGKAGLSVTAAGDAEGALAQLSDGAPDLVILDVVMPDATGWEVLRRIRERSDVPVLMLSARDSEVDKARGLDLGADDYVTKPFSLLEFEARVRRLLRRRPVAGASPA
jgi:DNA-binding response OmpR family regulator